MDLSGLELGQMAGCYKCGNEPWWDSIKCSKFHDYPRPVSFSLELCSMELVRLIII
jgi:hypothetical protein